MSNTLLNIVPFYNPFLDFVDFWFDGWRSVVMADSYENEKNPKILMVYIGKKLSHWFPGHHANDTIGSAENATENTPEKDVGTV